jgi:hypothetical protein
MAEADRPPTFTARVVDDAAKMTTVWYRFISGLARRVFAASQIAEITTADIATSTISTTSANAATQGGGYVQADVQTIATLANELKTDLAALIVEYNTTVALVNELKSTINEVTTALRE